MLLRRWIFTLVQNPFSVRLRVDVGAFILEGLRELSYCDSRCKEGSHWSLGMGADVDALNGRNMNPICTGNLPVFPRISCMAGAHKKKTSEESVSTHSNTLRTYFGPMNNESKETI